MVTAHLTGFTTPDEQAADALEIWSAGTESVLPRNVIPGSLTIAGGGLVVAGRPLPAEFSRIYVFGTGKAGAEMAVQVEHLLRGSRFWQGLAGQVNVPEARAGLPRTEKIQLQVARPAGQNHPTPQGVRATQQMIEALGQLDEKTLALGLISGGGSALLVRPRDGVPLEELQAVTRFLHNAGATIDELNGVRSWLDLVKAGGLARLCTAGRIETLIISDVVGDDLGVIASGPCQASHVTAAGAHEILRRFIDRAAAAPEPGVGNALQRLQQLANAGAAHVPLDGNRVRNNLIATNADAMRAARTQAEQRGYQVVMCGSTNQGEAYGCGRQFANFCQGLRELGGRWCVLSGGEPTLAVNPRRPKGCKGGRNQGWALASLDELWRVRGLDFHGLAILSGGTDGEDGPCDMAGGIASQAVLDKARHLGLDPARFMTDNNEYAFFQSTGGHLDTGGVTQTNVYDLRVACIDTHTSAIE